MLGNAERIVINLRDLLPVGSIELAISAGEIDAMEIVTAFGAGLQRAIARASRTDRGRG
jgi:hypothetical protein